MAATSTTSTTSTTGTTAPTVSTMTWSDSGNLLGSHFVETPFSYVITPTWTPSITDTSTISNVTISVSALNSAFTLTQTSTDCSISGPVSITVFDRYSVLYVDKGNSDRTQTPITSTLTNLPDAKEVIRINIDTRRSITVDVTATAIMSDGATYSTVNTLEIKQTYDMINTFTKDYFANRY